MRIVRADVYMLSIPFNFVFAHAAAERDRSDNVILRIELDTGEVGYGECLARTYVTGESGGEICAGFERNDVPLLRDLRFDDGPAFMRFARDCHNDLPGGAEGCLLELALLDAFGKAFGLGIADIFERRLRPHAVYSGVLGHVKPLLRAQFLRRMKDAGLQRVKVKVGFGAADAEAVGECREILGAEAAIGLDANAAWTPDEAVARIADLAKFDVDFVEQPVARDDWPGLADVTRRCDTDIVLDETVRTVDEAERAIRGRLCDGFNVRLSKVGGISHALALHDLACAHRLRYHIGALVGETGILATAGRHLATMTEPQAIEGSFGDLLLSEDVSVPSVRFGRRGIGERIDGCGLGIVVSQERIERHQRLHAAFEL